MSTPTKGIAPFTDKLLLHFIHNSTSYCKVLSSCVGTGKTVATVVERFLFDPIQRGLPPSKNDAFDKLAKRLGRKDLVGKKVIHRKGIIGRESQKGFGTALRDTIASTLKDYDALVHVDGNKNSGAVIVRSMDEEKKQEFICFTTFDVVYFSMPDSHAALHGGNFSWLWLNEVGLSDSNRWVEISALLSRLGRYGGRAAVVIDTNPPNPESWLFSKLGCYLWTFNELKRNPEGLFIEHPPKIMTDGITGETIEYGQMTQYVLREHESIREQRHLWSNPHLPPDYYVLEYEKTKHDKAGRNRLLRGVPTTQKNSYLVWEQFERDFHTISDKDSPFIDGTPFFVGMDQDAKGGAVLVQPNEWGQLVVLDEVDFQDFDRADWSQMAQKLKHLCRHTLQPPTAVILDHAGFNSTIGNKNSIQATELSNLTGFKFKAPWFEQNMPRNDRAQLVHNLFFEAPIWLQGAWRPRLVISLRCTRLITAIERWKHKTKLHHDGYEELIEPEKGRYSGLCDALIFAAGCWKPATKGVKDPDVKYVTHPLTGVKSVENMTPELRNSFRVGRTINIPRDSEPPIPAYDRQLPQL